MRTKHLAIAAVSGAALLLAAAATAGGTGEGGHSAARKGAFSTELAPLSQPGRGTVQIEQHGTRIDVDLDADGLDGGIHVAHIHGVRKVQSSCPTPAADADGDGLVDFQEGLESYGPVLVTLSNGTNDRGTSLDFARTFTHLDGGEGIASIGSLAQYAIVVHGVDLDGDGMATNTDAEGDGASDVDDNEVSMPALCGVITLR